MEVRRMRPKPKLSPLDKKIKPNPKYQNVEHVVETGPNIRTELEKLGEIHELYKFRNSEVFRRITINNLVDLIIEVSKLEYQLKAFHPVKSKSTNEDLKLKVPREVSRNHHRTSALQQAEEVDPADQTMDSLLRGQFDVKPLPPAVPSAAVVHSARSVTGLTRGIGELDDSSPEHELTGGVVSRQQVYPTRPFLILDVRDPELYTQSHISLSTNYPSMRLNRAFDYETAEMLRLKNKKNCLIIVYDDDETLASKCTTTMVQRGYENVFMLSGGLRVARLKYPESLVTDRELDRIEEGDIMVLEKLKEENVARGSYSRLTGSRMGTGASQRSGMLQSSSRRSVSLDRPSVGGRGGNFPGGGGGKFPGGGGGNFPGGGGFHGTRKASSRVAPPIRTSTALGSSRTSIFF